jgi:hypothetical protein
MWAQDRTFIKTHEINWKKFMKDNLRKYRRPQQTLTRDEVSFLMNKYYTDKRIKYKRTLSLCLFQIFTGARESDAFAINKTNIIDDGRIRYLNQKTKRWCDVDMNQVVADILIDNNYNLATMSLARYNDFIHKMLKEYSEEMPSFSKNCENIHYRMKQEIKEYKPRYELICSHTARRSFITLQVESGTPVTKIQQATQQNINTLFDYVHSVANNKTSISNDMLEYIKN